MIELAGRPPLAHYGQVVERHYHRPFRSTNPPSAPQPGFFSSRVWYGLERYSTFDRLGFVWSLYD